MPNDVFIACSRLNEYFAEQLETALQKGGLKTCLSLDNSNSEADDQIALGASRLMLIVASSPSLNSANIQAEIEIAQTKGLPIIAAQIGNLKSRPESLNDAIWVDEHKNQSEENIVAILAATATQLAAVMGETSVKAVGKPFDVFISHSSKDKAQANLLWKELEKRGYKCWIAPDSIKPGEDWPTAIEQGVEDSAVLALLFNSNSDESDEVKTELAFAKEYGTAIVSIRLEAVQARYKLKYFIWNKQWVSADDGPFSRQVERVATEIGKLLESNRANDSSPNPVETPEETGALKNIVNRVAGVAGAARLPYLPKREVSPTPETDEVDDVATIESAMKFRGVRQSRLFNAVRAGATDVEAVDKKGRTALHYAADSGELNIINLLLERGADINAADAEGLTPLHLAVDEVEVARLLLSKGADVTAKTNDGLAPLNCAINGKKTDTKNLFDLWSGIAHGYQSANDALKAGFVASHRYRAQSIIDAIAAGADDLTLTDAKGRNALHWAAREGELELVERLLKNGADARATDADGKTPAELARSTGKSGAQEVILMLNGWGNGGRE